MASDVFQSAQDRDDVLREKVSEARNRAMAYPDDRESQMALARACEDGQRMWEECEAELKSLDQASEDDDERSMLVREINMARNLAKRYGAEAVDASNAADSLPKSGHIFKKANGVPRGKKGSGRSGQAKSGSQGVPKPILMAIPIVLTIFFLSIVFGISSGDGSKGTDQSEQTGVTEVAQESTSEPVAAPESEPAPEPAEVVLFDGDTMRVTFEDWREEPSIQGCCYLYLTVENKTGSEVWFHSDYGTSNVNGYNGMFMQGMPTYVQPGNKAIMGIILTYQQFGVSSFDEVHTCDFDLVQEDKANYGSEFARAHIHVER